MDIIEFDGRYKQSFVDLNKAWIEEYFGFIEEEDLNTFDHIEEALSSDAMIYFAVEGEDVMATCMTRKMDGNTWEICKLGADDRFQGKGAGSGVLKACMDYAAAHGADRLYIESNSKLEAAMHLYRKFGFQEIPLNSREYARGNIAFEYIVH